MARALAVAAALTSACLLGGCTSGSAPDPSVVPAPPSPSTSGSPTPGGPDDTSVISLGGAPVGLAYGFGSVWVAVSDQKLVDRIGDKGEIDRQVPVGDTPLRLVTVARGVWVSEFRDGTVALVAPDGGSVLTRIHVGAQPEGLATDGTHLWVVLQQDARLVELDAATGALLRTLQLPAGAEPRLAAYAPAGPGRRATVWVSDYGGNRVIPVDVTSGRLGTPVPACAAPQGIAVGGASLWVACQGGWLVTVDLATHRARRVTDLTQREGNPDAVTVAMGKVWTALSTGPELLTVDPRTGRVTGQSAIADDGPLVNADVDVLVAEDQVWVTSFNGGSLHHVPVGSIGPAP